MQIYVNDVMMTDGEREEVKVGDVCFKNMVI